MANRGPNPGGQQKQLSPVIKLVLEHNPDDLARWRKNLGKSEEDEQKSYDNLAYKRRDQVVNDMKSGPKAFSNAALTLINLVSADPDSGLSASDLSALKTDVFDKTAAAIAKAEKEKAEVAMAKANTDKAKAQAEAVTKTAGEVHDLAGFLDHTLGKAARAQRRTRFTAFFQLLTEPQRQSFATGLKEGNQRPKFEALTECATATEAVLIAQANNWI